jgi:hypothetical protein
MLKKIPKIVTFATLQKYAFNNFVFRKSDLVK